MDEPWSTPFDELPTIGGTGDLRHPNRAIWWANLAFVACGLIGIICIGVYVVTG